jgi:hypothetical protein
MTIPIASVVLPATHRGPITKSRLLVAVVIFGLLAGACGSDVTAPSNNYVKSQTAFIDPGSCGTKVPVTLTGAPSGRVYSGTAVYLYTNGQSTLYNYYDWVGISGNGVQAHASLKSEQRYCPGFYWVIVGFEVTANAVCDTGTEGDGSGEVSNGTRSVTESPGDDSYSRGDGTRETAAEGGSCESTFGTGGGGSGQIYSEGDYTGGETVDWNTGAGDGGVSACGESARVEKISIEISPDKWVTGYATTCT